MKKPPKPQTEFSISVDATNVKKELNIVIAKLKQIKQLKKEVGIK